MLRRISPSPPRSDGDRSAARERELLVEHLSVLILRRLRLADASEVAGTRGPDFSSLGMEQAIPPTHAPTPLTAVPDDSPLGTVPGLPQ